MVRFAVDPESLRATAGKVEALRDDAGSFTETCSADPGHPGLAAAISELGAKAATSWSAASADLEETASRLRSSAEVYEAADQDSAPNDGGAMQ
jgi:hypothetical protein